MTLPFGRPVATQRPEAVGMLHKSPVRAPMESNGQINHDRKEKMPKTAEECAKWCLTCSACGCKGVLPNAAGRDFVRHVSHHEAAALLHDLYWRIAVTAVSESKRKWKEKREASSLWQLLVMLGHGMPSDAQYARLYMVVSHITALAVADKQAGTINDRYRAALRRVMACVVDGAWVCGTQDGLVQMQVERAELCLLVALAASVHVWSVDHLMTVASMIPRSSFMSFYPRLRAAELLDPIVWPEVVASRQDGYPCVRPKGRCSSLLCGTVLGSVQPVDGDRQQKPVQWPEEWKAYNLGDKFCSTQCGFRFLATRSLMRQAKSRCMPDPADAVRIVLDMACGVLIQDDGASIGKACDDVSVVDKDVGGEARKVIAQQHYQWLTGPAAYEGASVPARQMDVPLPQWDKAAAALQSRLDLLSKQRMGTHDVTNMPYGKGDDGAGRAASVLAVRDTTGDADAEESDAVASTGMSEWSSEDENDLVALAQDLVTFEKSKGGGDVTGSDDEGQVSTCGHGPGIMCGVEVGVDVEGVAPLTATCRRFLRIHGKDGSTRCTCHLCDGEQDVCYACGSPSARAVVVGAALWSEAGLRQLAAAWSGTGGGEVPCQEEGTALTDETSSAYIKDLLPAFRANRAHVIAQQRAILGACLRRSFSHYHRGLEALAQRTADAHDDLHALDASSALHGVLKELNNRDSADIIQSLMLTLDFAGVSSSSRSDGHLASGDGGGVDHVMIPSLKRKESSCLCVMLLVGLIAAALPSSASEHQLLSVAQTLCEHCAEPWAAGDLVAVLQQLAKTRQ